MFDEGPKHPGYLNLLHIDERDTLIALKAILWEDRDLSAQIVALLSEMDWRPQLVGATTMALGAADKATCAALWEAFDSGSWVAPQLAAAAFLTDPDFENQALSRIETGCPINRQRLEGLDWKIRHSAAGPESFSGHSAKGLSALVGLCKRWPKVEKRLETILSREDIQTQISGNDEGDGSFAAKWLDNFAVFSTATPEEALKLQARIHNP